MSTVDFVAAAVLAIGIGAAAHTIAKTKVTDPLRQRIGRAHRQREKQLALWAQAGLDQDPATRSQRFSYWASSLVGCPYCLSHWLSWAAVAVYRPRLLHLWLPLDLFAGSWPIIAAAMLTAGLLAKAMKA